MNERRKETAQEWGAYYGRAAVLFQFLHDHQFFTGLGIDNAAEAVSLAQWHVYHRLYDIPLAEEEYGDWEFVFVPAYRDIYTQLMQEYLNNEWERATR